MERRLGAFTKDLAADTDGRLGRQSSRNSSWDCKDPAASATVSYTWFFLMSLPVPSACFPTQFGWKWTFIKFASGIPRALSSAQPPSTCNKPVTRRKSTVSCEVPGDIILQTKKGHGMNVWSSETHHTWYGLPLGQAGKTRGPGIKKNFYSYLQCFI